MVPAGTSSPPPAGKQEGRIQAALAYLLAIVLPAATLLLRLALSSRFGNDPVLVLFFIPIVLSAATGGMGPGLVATALVALGTDYFLLPPKYSLAIESGLQSLQWLVLVLAGTLTSVLLGRSSRVSPGAVVPSPGDEQSAPGPGPETGISRTLLMSAGSICAALGAITLLGWFFHFAALTRVQPSFSPTAPNVAVGLLLDGLALLFVAAGRPGAALASAFWSSLVGLLTLAEYVFSVNLHIDELLVRDYLRAMPAYPGRPAPNAALCLVLVGIALFWAAVPRWRGKATAAIGVLGAVVFALGAAAVCGYLIGLPLYAMGDSKPMAANALGLGVMALAGHRRQPSLGPEERTLLWAEWKVRAGFALALAVLIVIGGMSYLSLLRLHEDGAWVEHTQETIATIRMIPAIVGEAEGAVRGYVIAGQEDFLEPYQRALNLVHADLGNLRRLTADNRVQQRRLDALEPLVAERLSGLQQTVQLRQEQGFGAAQQHVASGRGEQLHHLIRALLAETEATEQSLLQERATRAHRAGSMVKTVIVSGIALAFVFVAVALFVISQDFAGSRRAHAALEEARGLLEIRVSERTAELARTNEALHDSEARLAGIIDSAMEAIVTVDQQQRIVLFNPAAEKMFGRRATEVIGQPLDQFIPERFRSAHAQHHRDFAQTGLTRRHMHDLATISGLRASGEEFPIEAAISRVEVGGRQLFTAILRDITERVRAEEALRSNEAKFRSLVENSADAIAMQDAEGRILYTSPPVEHILGHCPEEFVGQKAVDFIHPDEHEQFEAVRRSLPKDSRPVLTRFRTRHKDGSWRIVESIRSNQLDNPDVRSVVVNFRDVTEMVLAEEALRRQAALIDQIHDAVLVWRWHGPITFWSRSAQQLYGYSTREVIGKTSHDLLRAEVEGGVAGFLRALEQKNAWEGELHHFTRDGRQIIVESRMTRVQDKGGVYVLQTDRDITERKRAEEEIRRLNADLERRVAQRTAELEAANQELESFSYSVSHDLRAPLRAMDGFSDALLEDYGPQLPEQAREYLETIRRGAQRMGALIDDLLAFSRLSRQSLAKQPINMEALVREVLEEVVPQEREKNIEIVNGNLPRRTATHPCCGRCGPTWSPTPSSTRATRSSRGSKSGRGRKRSAKCISFATTAPAST